MKRLKRKIFSHSGVTLVETLTAVLILALLSGIILVGSRSMLTVYQGHTFTNESAMVSDTINTALSDVLRYAVPDGEKYTNTVYQFSGSYLRIREGKIWLPGDGKQTGLLNSGAYSSLYVLEGDVTEPPDDPINYSGTVPLSTAADNPGVISGSYRLYDPFSGKLSDPITFSYRMVNADA